VGETEVVQWFYVCYQSWCLCLPQDLKLGDDTLLDHIKFADLQVTPCLSALQQAVVLGQW